MASFIRVKVYGNDKAARQFKELGYKVKDLEPAFAKIGAEIKRDAIPLTPVLSGALVRSIRVGKTKSSTVVRAGYNSKRLPYGAIQHYGGYHNIEGKHFLTTALVENRDYAEEAIESEIERLINRVGLG